jgi:hypothetical protein
LGFAERAGVTNSLAAALFSSDYTTQVDTRAAGVLWRPSPTSAFTWRLAAERDEPLQVNGSGLVRTFAPTLGAWSLNGVRLEVRGSGGTVPAEPTARRYAWSLQTSAGMYTGTAAREPRFVIGVLPAGEFLPRDVRPLVMRGQAEVQVTQPLGGDRALLLHTVAGAAGGRDLPPQWLVFAGGPWSAPGYDWHRFGTRALLSQRIEFRTPVPAPSVPLRRFGKSPPHATLAPFVQAAAIASGTADRRAVSGVYASAGMSVLLFYDLLRVDVARGLRDGAWRFAIDIDRSFWGIL